MSLEADINWIKSEIDNVKDPYLIETLKNLLNYRRQNKDNGALKEFLLSRAIKSEDDILHGRTMSRKDIENMTNI